MADTHKVKISGKDIESVSEKLHDFAKQLPPGEQNVMAWLLARAAEAPPEKESFLAPPGGAQPEAATAAGAAVLTKQQTLARSLGISQFARVRPGSLAAGSSIGVTGTVMF